MVEVTRTFTVATAPADVVDYLKDFGNATEWDPGTQVCERLGDGPIGEGAQWRNVSKIAGMETELTYELTLLRPGWIVFTGRNDTATSTDDIGVEPADGSGSTLTYHAIIEFHGAAKLGAPIAKPVFEKIGADTEGSLKRIFGAHD